MAAGSTGDDELGVLGKTLSHYQIEAKLGSGGMGTVYRATDTTLGRQVALKLLRRDLLEDASGIARFEREARALGLLNHPNIAAIYGFEEFDKIRFLSLEYVPGPTLAERLRRGAMPIRDAISMGRQIAEALEAAHAKNLIHRDLKPANVKVGENGQVKVLDFGLAKTIERSGQVSIEGTTATLSEDLTQKMTIIGTPAYMSPEQANGKELDARTDIWSFGCVMYEALTGKRVFPRSNHDGNSCGGAGAGARLGRAASGNTSGGGTFAQTMLAEEPKQPVARRRGCAHRVGRHARVCGVGTACCDASNDDAANRGGHARGSSGRSCSGCLRI